MKKLLPGTLLLALLLVSPQPMGAGVDVGINISLPHPIVFIAPPELIVLPETNVYVVPDVEAEIYFYGGWWWRPWEGGWYRSRHYDSDWSYYQHTPSFYRSIPQDWRNDYRERRWRGNQWNYQPVPHEYVRQNWSAWEKSRYWERHKSWGVQGLQPRMRSQQPSREMHRQPQAVQPQHSQHYRGEDQKSRNVNPQHTQQQQEKSHKVQKSQPQHPQHQQGKHQNGKSEKRDER